LHPANPTPSSSDSDEPPSGSVMEELTSITCVGPVINFFYRRFGSRSRSNRNTGIPTSSSDGIRPGLQAVFSDVEKPGVFGDMPHGAYRIRIPSMEGVHGVKAWVPKTKPRAHLKDFLTSILPPKLGGRVYVDLPPRPKKWSRKERSWKYSFLTPEDEFVMKLDNQPWKRANRDAWEDWRDKYECGKGQDRRKPPFPPRPNFKKERPSWRYGRAKDHGEMNVHPRVWVLRDERLRGYSN
jgi:hypothetical protein